MTRFSIVFLLLMSNSALSRDYKRYPFENAAYSGEVLSSHRVYFDFLPITLQIGVDPTFTSHQKQILDEAYKVFLEKALHPNTMDCVYKNSTKDFPKSEAFFTDQMIDALSPKGIGQLVLPTFLFISNVGSKENFVGVGYLSLYYDETNPLPGYDQRKHFYIGINSHFIGDTSTYYYKTNIHYWAGVIAHEILHNLGYDHPSGYPGSFIKEYGRCIANISTNYQWRDHVVISN